MNRRELVKAAIEHRRGERVPYCIDLLDDAWQKLKPMAGERSLEEFVDNDIKDFCAPWWQWHELGEDWARFEAPVSQGRVIGTGSYTEFIDSVKKAKDACDKYFLVRVYGSHFEKAYTARGFENFLADIGGSPDFARGLLNSIIDKNMVMLENILCLPEIDGVLLGSDWGSQRGLLMSPQVWQEMIRPGEQREYDLVHSYGKDVWVHSCGNVERLIPTLIEMGLDVLNPVQPEAMDVERLKKSYGDKLTFWGGLSTQKTLPFGTSEEVGREARALRAMMSENGGYVFAPAQSVQGDVPVENLLALFEVARETP